MNMTPEFAFRFAREWIDGANEKDFERVLALYSDDVEASSRRPLGEIKLKSEIFPPEILREDCA